MPPTTRCTCVVMTAIVSMILSCLPAWSSQTVTIGFNLPLTGPRQTTGMSTKDGAELLKQQINDAGGLQVGSNQYPVNFVYGDNKSDPQQAVNVTLDLITKKKVLGIVGPNASSNAIPSGGICESFKAPMVSPTSTNPRTTANRPFVFRACFLDNFQGEVMARFAIREFKAEKAAVLFNVASAYPKGLAEYFRNAFEQRHGKGSVVAYEKFRPNEKDLSAYMKRIVESKADVLFVPQYAHEIPSIVSQAREAGWDKIILGGDAWEAADLMEKCGEQCKGLFYSSHFAAIGAKGNTQKFVNEYQKHTNNLPTAYGALGYDSAKLLLTAISQLDNLGDNIIENRKAIRQQLASIHDFEGVSGMLDMQNSGDPSKSAVVIRINEKGEFESYSTESP